MAILNEDVIETFYNFKKVNLNKKRIHYKSIEKVFIKDRKNTESLLYSDDRKVIICTIEYYQGLLYLENGYSINAAKSFERAINQFIDSNDNCISLREIYHSLALAYKKQGRFVESAQMFEKANSFDEPTGLQKSIDLENIVNFKDFV